MDQYPEERQTKIGLNWAGFFFFSHVDFVEQEIQWLFDTYHHEKAVGLPVNFPAYWKEYNEELYQ
jgi:hypothetical protein